MEGERERVKHQCVVASCTPPTGDLIPPTQACVLTGNRTRDPLDPLSPRGPGLNPLSHTSQVVCTFYR